MPTRLQVLFPDDEIAAIRAAAERHRVTVAAWVRQTLREAIAAEGSYDAPALRMVRETARLGYQAPAPSPSDLEQLEALLTRLDGVDDDAEAAWDAEIARRLEDIHSGQARLVPAEEVFASIRRKYGW
jgi:putative addiction module component (TIGR02574 family)